MQKNLGAMNGDILNVMSELAKTDAGATMFVSGGGLEAVMELMECKGTDADHCMEVLEELYAGSESDALRKKLIDLQVAQRITAALKVRLLHISVYIQSIFSLYSV